jgi:predicted transcriptional regulator
MLFNFHFSKFYSTISFEVEAAKRLSLERVLKTLEGFGLSRTDAEVYVYLAKKGSKKGRELANALQITNSSCIQLSQT